MKTIGLIGGMSWESTRLYYDAINQDVRARLGGLHSAKLILHSVDFAPLADHLAAGRWDALSDILCSAAKGLELAGADCIASVVPHDPQNLKLDGFSNLQAAQVTGSCVPHPPQKRMPGAFSNEQVVQRITREVLKRSSARFGRNFDARI